MRQKYLDIFPSLVFASTAEARRQHAVRHKTRESTILSLDFRFFSLPNGSLKLLLFHHYFCFDKGVMTKITLASRNQSLDKTSFRLVEIMVH